MTAVVAVLATIGAMSVVASVGWFLFCWCTAASGDHDPAEPSLLATWQDSREAYRNVRVIRDADFTRSEVTDPAPRMICLFCGEHLRWHRTGRWITVAGRLHHHNAGEVRTYATSDDAS